MYDDGGVADDDDNVAAKVRAPAFFIFIRGSEKSPMRYKDLPVLKFLEQRLMADLRWVLPLLLLRHSHSALGGVSLLVGPSGGVLLADCARAHVLHFYSLCLH